MTVPATPSAPLSAQAERSTGVNTLSPPLPSVRFPLEWLLANASAPIQYRSVVEIADLRDLGREVADLPLTHRPALMLVATQSADGTWNHSMLATPSQRAEHFEGVGTVSAVRRLLEYGWHRDVPTLAHARRPLFRLLAEDDDPGQLFELAGRDRPDEDLVRRGRTVLREAAAAALAQAGYENDPRLRGAAARILTRIIDFLRSPLAEKPWIRIGNQHVLAPEAAPPSIYALTMLAYMPLFRTEYYEELDRLYEAIAQPLPRQESVQAFGKHVVDQPHLVLGDWLATRNALDADLPAGLHWLELVARLGFLRRNDGWSRLFDRLVDASDANGIWRPGKGVNPVKGSSARGNAPLIWHMFPLDAWRAGDGGSPDVTFRLGLIARASGRPLELG